MNDNDVSRRDIVKVAQADAQSGLLSIMGWIVPPDCAKSTNLNSKIERQPANIFTMHRFPFIITTILVALGFLFVTHESHAQAHTKGTPVPPFTPSLKPGNYVWHPEVSPAGPVVVLVSLPDQIL